MSRLLVAFESFDGYTFIVVVRPIAWSFVMATVADLPSAAEPIAAAEDRLEELTKLALFIGKTVDANPAVARCSLVGPNSERVELPQTVFQLLRQVVETLARGDAVTVLPIHKELTTQQAASLLNVSRQYLVRLLDQKEIPYHKTGAHRRVRVQDVLAYKKQRDALRKQKLAALTKLSEEVGGYSELD